MFVVAGGAGPGRRCGRRGRPKKKGKGIGKNPEFKLIHSCWARDREDSGDSGDSEASHEVKSNESDEEDGVG